MRPISGALRWWPAGVAFISAAALASTIGDPHPAAEILFMVLGVVSGLVGLTATLSKVRPHDWRVFQIVPIFSAEMAARVLYVWSLPNRTVQSKLYTTGFLVVIVLWSVSLAAATLTRYAIHDIARAQPEREPE